MTRISKCHGHVFVPNLAKIAKYFMVFWCKLEISGHLFTLYEVQSHTFLRRIVKTDILTALEQQQLECLCNPYSVIPNLLNLLLTLYFVIPTL